MVAHRTTATLRHPRPPLENGVHHFHTEEKQQANKWNYPCCSPQIKAKTLTCSCTCADPEGVGLKNHKNIGFLSNSGPDPLKNYEATDPVFNVGPSSARQRNAIFVGGPMMARHSAIWIHPPLINKKNNNV